LTVFFVTQTQHILKRLVYEILGFLLSLEYRKTPLASRRRLALLVGMNPHVTQSNTFSNNSFMKSSAFCYP